MHPVGWNGGNSVIPAVILESKQSFPAGGGGAPGVGDVDRVDDVRIEPTGVERFPG